MESAAWSPYAGQPAATTATGVSTEYTAAVPTLQHSRHGESVRSCVRTAGGHLVPVGALSATLALAAHEECADLGAVALQAGGGVGPATADCGCQARQDWPTG